MVRGGGSGAVGGVRERDSIVEVTVNSSPGTCLADWDEESCVCVCFKLQTLLSGLQEILEEANEVLESVFYHGILRDLF